MNVNLPSNVSCSRLHNSQNIHGSGAGYVLGPGPLKLNKLFSLLTKLFVERNEGRIFSLSFKAAIIDDVSKCLISAKVLSRYTVTTLCFNNIINESSSVSEG